MVAPRRVVNLNQFKFSLYPQQTRRGFNLVAKDPPHSPWYPATKSWPSCWLALALAALSMPSACGTVRGVCGTVRGAALGCDTLRTLPASLFGAGRPVPLPVLQAGGRNKARGMEATGMDVVSTWGEVAGAVYSRRQSLVTREVQDYPHLQPLPPATLTALVPAGRASGKHNTTSGKHASGKHKAARGRPGGRVCQDPSCQQVATFGHPAGGGPVNCRAHKALDDELVRGWNPCQSAEGCTRKAVFGFRSGRYTLSPISSRLLSSPPLSSPLLSCTPCQASPLLCTLSRVPLSLHPVTRLSSSLLLLSSSPCLACDWSVLCVGLYCVLVCIVCWSVLCVGLYCVLVCIVCWSVLYRLLVLSALYCLPFAVCLLLSVLLRCLCLAASFSRPCVCPKVLHFKLSASMGCQCA